LADTNIFIWCDSEPRLIKPALLAILQDTRNEVFVSTASVWELAIKRALGKLTFAASIVDKVGQLGFGLLPISGAHAEHAGGLPRHHGDPFDRLIVAQAQLEGLVLATSDVALGRYGVAIMGSA
jgi:PIN domain nuclease of toxin-antitoxin system